MINQEIANNIFYHIGNCWDYNYPTGQALETAISRGLDPFFSTQQLGSPNTITDVKADNVSIDVKGNKTLKFIKKLNSRTNFTDNNVVEFTIDGEPINLSVPKSIMTQVRRPTVDLQGYNGDPEMILSEQISEYENFVWTKSKQDGCEHVMSFIVQYGERDGLKAVTLTTNEFDVPQADKFETTKNTAGANNAYVAYDSEENEIFRLSSFNRGSSNMYKRYPTETFYYRVWKDSPYKFEYDCTAVDQEFSLSKTIVDYYVEQEEK